MRKPGKRNALFALTAALSMGSVVSAYANPLALGSVTAVPVQSAASVIVAGQSQQQENTSTSVIVSGQSAPTDSASPVAGPGIAPEMNDSEAPTVPAETVVSPEAPDNSSAQSVESETQIPAEENGSQFYTTGSEQVLMAKTDGVNGQLTNVSFLLNGVEGAISYGVYVNNGGYLPWKGDGLPAGGTEDSTYVEAIQMAISGEAAKVYDVYYRGTSAHAGQHGWACNEELMGTIDRGDWLTGIEVRLVPKGSGAPGSYEGRFFSNHSEYIHISDDGSTYYVNGVGYTGWVDHDRARYYFQDGIALTGWHYVDGLKFYFNNSGAMIMDVDDIIGKQSSYQLHVNKTLNCLTVFAKDGDNGYTIPVKAMLTSVGDDTPLGTFTTPEKYRWRLMVNDSWTQYATRIKAGAGFLFHSITYESPDNMTLFNNGYNNLGVSRSLGCVRLTCANAKWVYDNCKLGTEVVIYEDAEKPGPFFKPYQVWIPKDQRWDPTDPACAGL
ncbi:MAG: L,D-transpeptidase family protein [Brotaphodocola sp.]